MKIESLSSCMKRLDAMRTERDTLCDLVAKLEAASKLALHLLEAGDLLCEVFAATALRKALAK